MRVFQKYDISPFGGNDIPEGIVTEEKALFLDSGKQSSLADGTDNMPLLLDVIERVDVTGEKESFKSLKREKSSEYGSLSS